MAKTNKEIINSLEAKEWARKWDSIGDYTPEELVKCRKCFHSEPLPKDAEIKDRVYCITYDTLKRCDGFCELGTIRPKNEEEN